MLTESFKLKVFLCHTSQDKPVIRALYLRLRDVEWIEPWLDEEKILPGQDWDTEIGKALENTNVVIVCLSNNSFTKEGYIQTEIKKSLDIANTKPEDVIFIIPIRLDDCQIPSRLKKYQYCDFFSGNDQDNAFDRLLISLNERLKDYLPRIKEEEIAKKYVVMINELSELHTVLHEHLRILMQLDRYFNGLLTVFFKHSKKRRSDLYSLAMDIEVYLKMYQSQINTLIVFSKNKLSFESAPLVLDGNGDPVSGPEWAVEILKKNKRLQDLFYKFNAAESMGDYEFKAVALLQDEFADLFHECQIWLSKINNLIKKNALELQRLVKNI